MTAIPKSPTTDFTSTTLTSTITDSVTLITVNDASTLQAPCYIVVDREDSNGTATPNQREVMYVESKSSNNLTVVRGVDNSTARSHNAGAIVEPMITVGFWDDMYDAYDNEHDPADGSHDITKVAILSGTTIQTLTNKILSNATITTAYYTTHISVSGASVSGLPIIPVWVMPGTSSAASVSCGKPMDMPKSGNIEWVSVVLRSPVSSASLIFDVNKNFVSIFEAGTRISILGGGTFASTASVNTKGFIEGDIFSVDIDAGGSFSDAVLKFKAR